MEGDGQKEREGIEGEGEGWIVGEEGDEYKEM